MEWFKGPEGKVHQKESEENDAWILDMYDAYLEQMGDEAANLPYSIKDKKAKKKQLCNNTSFRKRSWHMGKSACGIFILTT